MDRLTGVGRHGAGTAWDEIIDGIEAEVLRTENWLVLALTDPGAFIEGDFDPAPDLTAMPVVPPSVLPRIVALRERIARVTRDLEDAMTANRRQAAALAAARPYPVLREVPRFVDRAM